MILLTPECEMKTTTMLELKMCRTYHIVLVRCIIWSKHCLHHEFVFAFLLWVILKGLEHNCCMEKQNNTTITSEVILVTFNL